MAMALITLIRPHSARSATKATTGSSIARSRRLRPSRVLMVSTPRTGECRRAWGLSSIGPESIWGRPTALSSWRVVCSCKAVKTVQEGGDPLGTDTSYYNARAVEQVLPKGVAWRDALLSEMYPASEPLAAAD